MDLFSKNSERILYQYDKDKIMAREILGKWGEKVQLYNSDYSLNGGNYNEYVYNMKGLELVYSEIEGIFIIYNDKKVLANSSNINGEIISGKKTYIPGEWEDQLKVIYSLAMKASSNNNEDSLYDKGVNVLSLLDAIGSCKICDNITIVRDDIRFNNDNNNLNITYNVFCDDELVFSGSYLSSNREKIYVYEPGDWENEIKMYIKGLLLEREEYKKQLTRRLKNEIYIRN